MMDDLDKGDIDVALMWGPLAGYYAAKAKTPTARSRWSRRRAARGMVYRIAMGVRHSDQNWKRDLNKLISENRGEIERSCAPTACRCSTRTTSRSRPDNWRPFCRAYGENGRWEECHDGLERLA